MGGFKTRCSGIQPGHLLAVQRTWFKNGIYIRLPEPNLTEPNRTEPNLTEPNLTEPNSGGSPPDPQNTVRSCLNRGRPHQAPDRSATQVGSPRGNKDLRSRNQSGSASAPTEAVCVCFLQPGLTEHPDLGGKHRGPYGMGISTRWRRDGYFSDHKPRVPHPTCHEKFKLDRYKGVLLSGHSLGALGVIRAKIALGHVE